MDANPYYYPQEGHIMKRPRKRRLKRFITVISIILIISVLSMTVVNYFVEPVFISRLTKGVLFGFHTTQVDKADISNPDNLSKPDNKEIKEFSNFAGSLFNRFYLSLNSEEKEDFTEIKDGVKTIAAHLKKLDSARNPSPGESLTTQTSAENNELVHKDIESLVNLNFSSIALGSSGLFETYTPGSEEKNEDDVFTPEVLNGIASYLYANGYTELASAVASMAALDYPDNPISVLNFATVLREANADEDAFNVLQYGLRLAPDNEPILYSLGMCALDLGNTPYAEKCFSRILALDASSGPGHQGMMLCYMDTGSYSSAFLHMIEGAREGYTTMITETYKVLREKNEEYKDIAKPIFEQYTLEQLVDFSKSRVPFDITLDTPGGQLDIPRNIKLGRNSAAVYSSSSAILEGLQYCMEALSHAKATFSDAYSAIGSIGGLIGAEGELSADDTAKLFSKSILKKIFDAAANGPTVSSEGWLTISYEKEVFWLNIIDDYIQIKLEELTDEYLKAPLEEISKEPSSVIPSLTQYFETYNMLAQSNPIQAATKALTNMVYNNSAVDKGVQKANRKDLDNFLEKVNPKLEEGYKKTADLMEVYWLHYGAILGQIGNDETYNRYQQQRKTTVACALTPYVAAGAINCFFVSMNYIAVESNAGAGSGGEVIIPQFPNFPGSSMGTAYKPPPPKPPATENTGQQEETTQQESSPEQQGQVTESTNPGDAPSETTAAKPQTPGQGKPKESEITTEDSISIFIGPLTVSLSDSGWEVDLTLIGSFNLRRNTKTGDISIFGGFGVSVGAATSGASARAGVYTTINTRTNQVTSGARFTADAQLAGNGVAFEREMCTTTGADTTTVSAILLHKKSSQTIDNN